MRLRLHRVRNRDPFCQLAVGLLNSVVRSNLRKEPLRAHRAAHRRSHPRWLLLGADDAPSRSRFRARRGARCRFDPVLLSPEGRRAFAILRDARRFTDDAIYDGGDTPREVVAWRILHAEPAGADAMRALWATATLEGRLYALCGLYYADPEAFRGGIATLRGTGERVEFQTGCETIRDQAVAELIERRGASVVRLETPSQTTREWVESHPEAAGGYLLDIAGGGYPDLFRTSGGYGELARKSLDEGAE